MFSAIDIRDNQRVILLDYVTDDAKETLRQAVREGNLHCPICNQAVIVRLGVERRPHCAHRHLSNCPSSQESPELLQARAVLYQWLKSKFDSGVTIEKQLEGVELPRWIDCWVDTPRGSFAYWIIEKNTKPTDRFAIQRLGEIKGVSLNIVFLSQMMARNENPTGVLNLTTTEREFFAPSDYNLIYVQGRGHCHTGSLHYLDGSAGNLATFRAMRCSEPPQQYSGTELGSQLAEVKVSPSNGEMVHPSEVEALARRKQQIANEIAAEERLRAEQEAKSKAEAEAWAKVFGTSQPGGNPSPTSHTFRPLDGYDRKVGTCIFCGITTTNWWRRDGATGKCQCRPCRAKGVMDEGDGWVERHRR